jgi:DNA-binding NtrC family response regulator
MLLTERVRLRDPGLPVLLCTGNADAVAPAALQRLGIRALLRKPIDAQHLRAAVQRCLSPGR